ADEEDQEAGIPEKAASDVEMIEDERRVGGERDDADGQRRGSYDGPTDRPAFRQPRGEVCRADARRIMLDAGAAAGKDTSGQIDRGAHRFSGKHKGVSAKLTMLRACLSAAVSGAKCGSRTAGTRDAARRRKYPALSAPLRSDWSRPLRPAQSRR